MFFGIYPLFFQKGRNKVAQINKYELKNGKVRYEVQIYLGIDPQTKKQRNIHKRGFTSEKQARSWAKNTEADIDNGRLTVNDHSNMLMTDWLNEWLDKWKINVKEGSMIIYRYQVQRYLIPNIGNYKLKDYTRAVHEQFINSLLEHGKKDNTPLSWNTVKIINATISNALEKATRIGYIRDNPTRFLEINKKYDNRTKRLHYWTVDQTEIFLKAAIEDKEPVWYVFFLTVLDLGLRKGEAMALKWSDVDFDSETVSINKTRLYRKEVGNLANSIVLDTPKTEAGRRTLQMTERLKTVLKWFLNHSCSDDNSDVININLKAKNDDEFIFRYTTHKRGAVIRQRSVDGAFTRICKGLDLPKIHIHDLRHTHAVFMREAGVSLDDIKDTLGHKELSTTQIYAEVTPKVIQQASEKYEKYVQKKDAN